MVPCYNEQETVAQFYEAVAGVLKTLTGRVDHEVIFVDDGSGDATLLIIKDICSQYPDVKYLSFSRNFGKESALYAGLAKARGDYAVVMDCDLQDPPALLPDMLAAIQDGDFDSVATRRVTRKGEPALRSFFARTFYRIINKISDTEFVDGARDYRMMDRKMVDAILKMKESDRFSKGLYSWVGFSTKWVEYENVQRVAGETKWSTWRLFIYSLNGIMAFSAAPLAISSFFGLFLCFASIAYGLFMVIRTWIFGNAVPGYPSLFTAIVFIGGVQLFCIGILGMYVAKVFEETKKRPLYVTKEESEG